MRTTPGFRAPFFLLSAILLTLAQPPFPTGWLAYVALVPYLIGLEGLRGRRAFGYGFLWGFATNLFGLYWVALVTLPGLFAALIYLSILDGIFTVLLCRIRSDLRGYLLPFLWTAFVFAKSAGEMGFPWLTLALTQTWTPAAIQGASLAGAWLLDLWVAAVNGLTYKGLQRLLKQTGKITIGRGARALAPAAALAILVLLYGRIVLAVGGAGRSEEFSALHPRREATGIVDSSGTAERGEAVPPWVTPGTRPLRVAAIQGSVRPELKLKPHLLYYNTYLYRRLSRAALAAAGGDLDLIVWPESAVPQYLNASYRTRREVQGIQRELGIPVITGAFAYFTDPSARGGGRSYNAAFMLAGDYISTGDEVYRKRMLVPFGERVPYQWLFGFMTEWSMGWSDFSRGKHAPRLGGPPATPQIPPIGLQICYESIFARLVRPQVVDGAQVLAIITNDSWFGRTSGPFQHMRAATLRAVEFRRPVIRSANSGVSGLIDRWGQIHDATPLFVKTAVIGRVWPERGLTLYARTGDWLPLLAVVLSVVALFLFRAPAAGREGTPAPLRAAENAGT